MLSVDIMYHFCGDLMTVGKYKVSISHIFKYIDQSCSPSRDSKLNRICRSRCNSQRIDETLDWAKILSSSQVTYNNKSHTSKCEKNLLFVEPALLVHPKTIARDQDGAAHESNRQSRLEVYSHGQFPGVIVERGYNHPAQAPRANASV
jgi:hypothetical protein